MHNKNISLYPALILSFMACTTTCYACTTWGAIDKAVQSGNLLIAKNRDNPPSVLESLKFNKAVSKKLVSYVSLSYKNNTNKKTDYPFVSAGINQYGLVVVNNAAATTHEKNHNNREIGETALIRKLLSHFHTVSQIVSHQDQLFKNAQVNHLLIGDPKSLILVEIGHHHLFTIQHANQSMLYLFHTNTYESKRLTQFNTIQYKDSQIRYRRMKVLLKQTQQPFTVNDYWRISYDRNAGANSSIFRNYTEATWIVKEAANKPPILYVRFTNPNQPYANYKLKLDKSFWQLNQKRVDAILNEENHKAANQPID